MSPPSKWWPTRASATAPGAGALPGTSPCSATLPPRASVTSGFGPGRPGHRNFPLRATVICCHEHLCSLHGRRLGCWRFPPHRAGCGMVGRISSAQGRHQLRLRRRRAQQHDGPVLRPHLHRLQGNHQRHLALQVHLDRRPRHELGHAPPVQSPARRAALRPAQPHRRHRRPVALLLAYHAYPGLPLAPNSNYVALAYSTDAGFNWQNARGSNGFARISPAGENHSLCKAAYDHAHDIVWYFWKKRVGSAEDLVGAGVFRRGEVLSAIENLTDLAGGAAAFHNFAVGPDGRLRAHYHRSTVTPTNPRSSRLEVCATSAPRKSSSSSTSSPTANSSRRNSTTTRSSNCRRSRAVRLGRPVRLLRLRPTPSPTSRPTPCSRSTKRPSPPTA